MATHAHVKVLPLINEMIMCIWIIQHKCVTLSLLPFNIKVTISFVNPLWPYPCIYSKNLIMIQINEFMLNRNSGSSIDITCKLARLFINRRISQIHLFRLRLVACQLNNNWTQFCGENVTHFKKFKHIHISYARLAANLVKNCWPQKDKEEKKMGR